MLKSIRTIIAIISLAAVTLLFLDFTGTAQKLWPWMAKIQFMPALLSLNAAALLALLLGTLMLGRVYCSVICPLGILQDTVNWLRGRVGNKRKRKNRFRYVPAKTKTRLAVLGVFTVLVIIGLTNVLAASIAGLIEPYSAYGRIASQMFAPAYDWINNLLASWSESQIDNYAFYRVAISVSAPLLAVAIITFIAVATMSWRGGRDYCNTICPVGTILGYLSKYSLLKPVINTEKCINCGKCMRNCKAQCINSKAHDIDYSRCVACMDCISVCQEGAISYTARRTRPQAVAAPITADRSRRGFIIAGALLSGTALSAKITDGGLTALKDKKPAQRATRIAPPGAKSLSHLSGKCTACQLCIQACPNNVLKPTLSIEGFMQPHLDFTDGYCTPECTVCSSVCPVGAILPIDEAEKSSTKIGTAVVDPQICISATEGVQCGSCAKHCPAAAITMVEVNADSELLRPAVDEEACIGCGSCEFHCPAGTVDGMASEASAIHVEGILRHREI
ncbi:MAG: 4Fe-4S binding protein [Clostridium sp.]|nr:4Fe-4S binding protein [Clostridium sp.]